MSLLLLLLLTDNNLVVHVHGSDILDAFRLFQATQSSTVQTAWRLLAGQLQ